mgnify:CR=1 FL=1
MQWTRNTSDSLPPTNRRILVSDGETMTIASFINDNPGEVWIFENSNFKDLRIFWWCELPEMPPVILTQGAV